MSATEIRKLREELAAKLTPDPGPVWEVHVLHSLPAGNPNRDRFQRPKEQTFGGTRRARISSQALKRAAREQMRDALAGETLGLRTRNVATEVAKAIKRLGPPGRWDEQAIDAIAREAVTDSKLKPGKSSDEGDSGGEDGGEAIVFVSEAELEHVARVLCEHADDIVLQVGKAATTRKPKLGAEVKRALDEPFAAALRPIEAALTGRFFASRPQDTVEAAVQVMHTVGIHPLLSETDFFSAVEERPVEQHAGAAHTDDAEFNASCHYKYARIDVPHIALNLDTDEPVAQLDRARRAARAFVAAFIDAVPRAKQATMNTGTPASFALIVRRKRGGWNLANAFVNPLRQRAGLVVAGVHQLDAHLGALLESSGDHDLLAIDIINRTGCAEKEIAPIASGWRPGTHEGRMMTLLDRLAPKEG